MESELSAESKLKEVYKHPVGHDIIKKLLTAFKMKEGIITNPIIGNMRLQTLSSLTCKNFDNFQSLIKLMNQEKDIPDIEDHPIREAWWKEAVFYQIYPKSFMDSNGDGIGDLTGIISKLDYLKELGVDAIWLSPIYDSPNDDNGYDIRDYQKILQEFGSMQDFEMLTEEIHKRGMRLIMDAVLNHTSDEHPWFQEALKNPESKYHNYYIFKKGNGKNPPNNWRSFFGGSAWNYYEETDEWALHLFSKKQMDLNWECKEMRDDIIGMLRWWLDKGVDGFRMDAINYISKQEDLPDGNLTIAEVIGYCGIEHYFYGPKLHTYLKEIRKQALDPYQAFSVGEMPGIGTEMQKLLTGDLREELNMMIAFDHLETPGHKRYHQYQYDLEFYKEYLTDSISQLGNQCHMALYYNNHDNPRFLSKVAAPARYRSALAKMLAVIQFTSRGTPFIFQGDEFGAANHQFTSMDQIRDIEARNFYKNWIEQVGMTSEKAFSMVASGTRDQGRTPMQWNSKKNGGFSTGTPWIESDEDYLEWNVEKQLHEEDSILNFYKKLIFLRKKEKAFAYGETIFIKKHVKHLFLYERIYHGKRFFIECNLTDTQRDRFYHVDTYQLLLSTQDKTTGKLSPFEANIYLEP